MINQISKIKITSVVHGSAAEEAGIEPGDWLTSINGGTVKDVFDYEYMVEDENITLGIEKSHGENWEIEIEKDSLEDIGLVFEDSLMDSPKACRNKCIFCFMDQLAPGMRKTLHFKDDDYRLSFLEGNYVTLTNASDDELDRIVFYKLSPINVSVHTTNPELRRKMLNNPDAGKIISQIEKLAKAGITINCQIVLCKGFNDSKELDRTIEDLGKFYPHIKSISVVPVGLTRYREKCFELQIFDANSSLEVIRQVRKHQLMFMRKFGTRIVFLADEFYLNAGMKIPSHKHYEDFPQIENGVGMMALFKNEFNNRLKSLKFELKNKRSVSLVTGMAAINDITEMTSKLTQKFNNIEILPYGIENEFFGKNITVAGLLTGKDIVNQLKGKKLGEELLVPEVMLKHDEDIFLDDVTLEQLERELDIKVRKVRNDGRDFIDAVLGISQSRR